MTTSGLPVSTPPRQNDLHRDPVDLFFCWECGALNAEGASACWVCHRSDWLRTHLPSVAQRARRAHANRGEMEPHDSPINPKVSQIALLLAVVAVVAVVLGAYRQLPGLAGLLVVALIP